MENLKLSREDARRALVNYLFPPCSTAMDAFRRLRSIQFDPIAPVGCNHDLVLQARVPGYQIGDWEPLAYQDREIYDGWDKQASLVPFEAWPSRRIFHSRHPGRFQKIFEDHAGAVQAILEDLRERGPLMPSECVVKERKEEWKTSWHGPNLAKQVLRALWHTGQVMTSGRRKGKHVYDLAERVVPSHIFAQPPLSEGEATAQLFLDRHRATGILRPTASYEVWSYFYAPERVKVINELLQRKSIFPVQIESVKAHLASEFLESLDKSPGPKKVRFIAPLDQLMWDRKLVLQLFDFDYVWEIYTPEPKRKWGYYVLPVLYGDELVARIEFYCRNGLLEVRRWIEERSDLGSAFDEQLEEALKNFMLYSRASRVVVQDESAKRIRAIAKRLNKG